MIIENYNLLIGGLQNIFKKLKKVPKPLLNLGKFRFKIKTLQNLVAFLWFP